MASKDFPRLEDATTDMETSAEDIFGEDSPPMDVSMKSADLTTPRSARTPTATASVTTPNALPSTLEALKELKRKRDTRSSPIMIIHTKKDMEDRNQDMKRATEATMDMTMKTEIIDPPDTTKTDTITMNMKNQDTQATHNTIGTNQKGEISEKEYPPLT